MTANRSEPTERKIDPRWAAACGICCRLCEFYHSPRGLSCGGCHEERLCRVDEGQCFFVTCTREHAVEHCGLCPEFPCRKLFESHQACAGDNAQVAVLRIGDLALRSRMGTAEWLRAKLAERLPDAWDTPSRAGAPFRKERRRHRRSVGRWRVVASFLPAPQAFGLYRIETECRNAGPAGLLLCLPESARPGFEALVRTGRPIEVCGEFPTSHGTTAFSGRVVWHNAADESAVVIKAGIELAGAGEK
jgi:hypothetical protein